MNRSRVIQVYEGRIYTLEGIKYYLKHRKEFTKDTLAKALTTRDDKGYSTRSLLSIISLILKSNYFVIRDGTKTYVVDPLFKLQQHDMIGSIVFLCCRYWEYDGEKVYFIEDR